MEAIRQELREEHPVSRDPKGRHRVGEPGAARYSGKASNGAGREER